MKKHFEKIISIALSGIALMFVVFLLIMIFNTDLAIEANNTMVHILFIVFASLFAVLAALSIWSAFNDHERVNQILLFKTQNGAKKASVSVIRKLAKTAVTPIASVKVGSVHVFVDETGEVYLKATVKIVPKKKDGAALAKASVILEQVNAALQLEFMDVLNLEFKEIELKLIKAKHYTAPDMNQINAKVDEQQLENGNTELATQANDAESNDPPIPAEAFQSEAVEETAIETQAADAFDWRVDIPASETAAEQTEELLEKEV